ncbi:proteasome assembly chaperone 4-like [Haemaphysalis longicornis]|uniref:Proteasome assembly chaperone n=1 Tax=Haemaphysalis longicornis TaxID=44386 RepID=A0A9J6GYK9_HAELO|nr:hypothetical protein HPB48_025083 [Haemaphysalis longicornis]
MSVASASCSNGAAAEVPPVDLGFGTYQFSRHFNGAAVHFLVLRMDSSFFLWIGSQSRTMSNLSVAMSTAYEKAPIASHLMGDASDPTSNALASKLSKRTGCQVFVSYNLANTDAATVNFVHECLVEEMTLHPEKFH